MRKFRGFCTAFTMTMCVLGLGVGLFIVGYNSRKMAQGEGAGGTYRLESGQLKLTDAAGNEMTVQMVDEQKPTTPAVPAPVRVTLHLLRGVATAAEQLAEKLEG